MRYKVIGKNHKVFGKKFGEFFERNLPDAQERNLIGGGHIVRAPVEEAIRPSVKAVVLVKEPSAANDAPTTPEGMSTDEQEAYSA